MSIEVSCSECGASHHVNDRLAGRSVRCPSCDAVVPVPDKSIGAEVESGLAGGNDAGERRAEVVAAEPIAVESVDKKDKTRGVASRESATAASVAASSAAAEEEDEDEIDEVLIRKKRPEEEMDMTPMVDVTFLLLIFFMVTAAFSLQKSIEMPRQQTDAPSTQVTDEEDDELETIEVEVDEFGGFLVIAQDWERETVGKQGLIRTFKEALSASKDAMRLNVKVHEMAKLHSLVDAMDAGTIAGFAELEVVQVEEFY
ncbi:MAG: biopolymer transporter ExbD [Rubripirellula sp.]|nr:biopolymer transporter ExbD [Rhodopirellula sp.]MCP4941844.1 biopolymer transporter ExbD [Planctomycetaceae bacterium]